jgi:hypothetical protein
MVVFSTQNVEEHVSFGPYETVTIEDEKMIVCADDQREEFGHEFCLATIIIKDSKKRWRVNDGLERGSTYMNVRLHTLKRLSG